MTHYEAPFSPRHEPRSRGFFHRNWDRVKFQGTRGVLVVAFVLQIIGLSTEWAAEVAVILLPLAVFFLFEVVRDIYGLLQEKTKRRSYLSLQDVRSAIEGPIKKHAYGRRVRVQMIALTMNNQWDAVKKVFEDLRNDNRSTHVVLDIAVIDPNADNLPGIHESMSAITLAKIGEIKRFCEDIAAVGTRDEWDIRISGLSMVPGVAGILVDEVTLFRTLTDIQTTTQPAVRQGEEMYEQFDYPGKAGESFETDTIDHFKRLLIYHQHYSRELYRFSTSQKGPPSEPSVIVEKSPSESREMSADREQ